MNVRGDLKIWRDLIVQTASSTPEIGRILTSVSTTGKVEWSDLAVAEVRSAGSYNKGSLVTVALYDEIFMARVDLASGGDVYNSVQWLKINGGSGGGTGGVEEYAAFSAFPPVGQTNVIYIDAEFGSLYRWGTVLQQYQNVGGGISTAVKASVAVGGIIKSETVPVGTDLREFIDKLINPEVEATITLPTYSFEVNNVVSARIGTTFSLNYSNSYGAGTVKGYDLAGNNVTYGLKSSVATYAQTPSAGTAYSVVEDNSFDGTATYTEGTPAIYTSAGNLSTADRSAGTLDRTYSFTGFYEAYIGMAATDSNAIIQHIQAGTLPSGTFTTINYTAHSQRTVATTLIQGLASIYVAMPANKFTTFIVKSATFDTVLTEADYAQDFDVSVDGNITTMKLYTLDFNGYDENMNADLIINI